MVDDAAQRHLDATRDDPPNGETREIWLKSRLKKYLRDDVIFRMVSRGETVTGREISREIVDYCDIRALLWMDHLDREQRIILLSQFGPDDLPLEECAKRAGVSLPTAYRKRHYALQAIGRRYYDDPTWEMPWRNQVQKAAREYIADYLRELGV